MGACVAGLVVLAGVLVASPARAEVTPVVFIDSPQAVRIDADVEWFVARLAEPPCCGQPVNYDWDFNADGAYDDSSGELVPWTPSHWATRGPGTYNVGVRVTVGDTSAVATASIQVTPPSSANFTVNLGIPPTAEVGELVYIGATVRNFPEGASLTFAWELDGDGDFADVTDPTTDLVSISWPSPGIYLVRVRVRHDQMDPTDQPIDATTNVRVSGSVSLTTPTISGTAKVGRILSADGAMASPTDAVRAFVWLRDSANISGATMATYQLTTADAGRSISLRVLGTSPGYASATTTSKVLRVAAHNSVRPTFSGTLRVGRKLTGTRGTWYAPNHTYTYRWLRDGKAISGATGLTYVTKSTDRGRRISLRVTRQRAGFPTVHAFSVARTIAR